MADPNEPEPVAVTATAVAPQPIGFLARVGVRWRALRKRLSDHFAEYGAVAFATYLAIFGLTWFGFTVAIRSGVSVDGTAESTGSIGAAYIATQLVKPLRILATIAITPFTAMLWDRIRGRSRKPAAETPKSDGPA